MRISELILQLEEEKKKHGDVKVVTTEESEYWGILYNEVTPPLSIDRYAQPEGPKSGKSEPCLVLN